MGNYTTNIFWQNTEDKMGCGTGAPIEYSWENVIPPWQQRVAEPLGAEMESNLARQATPYGGQLAAPISDPMIAAGNILMNEYYKPPAWNPWSTGPYGGYGGGGGGGGIGPTGRGVGMQGPKSMPDMSTLYDQMGPVSNQLADPNLVFQQPMPNGPTPTPNLMFNPYMGMGNPYSPYYMPINIPPFSY
jgi:hypothetical protein